MTKFLRRIIACVFATVSVTGLVLFLQTTSSPWWDLFFVFAILVIMCIFTAILNEDII